VVSPGGNLQALATSTAAALGTAIGAAIGTEIPVPLLGSALGALAGWLLGSAWAFRDCDGPVAAAVHVFTGASLRRAMTAVGVKRLLRRRTIQG
jgi:hypothetical protein